MTHHKNLPTIIGYSLALVTFFVLAAAGVGYATGYRLDWKTLQLEKTGVLAVTSRPAGATVWVNGKQHAKKTPIAIRNVAAGDYEVRLLLDGYREYTADLQVSPGLATELAAVDMVLEQPDTTQIATDIAIASGEGNGAVYRTNDKRWWRVGESAPEELTFDKLPPHVKSALSKATKIDWLKKSISGGSWAANITVDGKKWLAIFDIDGFRGALLAAPLSQATENDLDFIDNDHLLGKVAGTVYGLDLNTNKLTTVSKTALGAQAWAGKTILFAKNETGEITAIEDGNVFDDKPGQTMDWILPTGKDHRLIDEIDGHLLLTTNTGNSETLWLLSLAEGVSDPTVARISADYHGLSVNKDKQYFTYAAADKLMKYDLSTEAETILRSYPKQKVVLLGQRNTTLFVGAGSGLELVDATGQNGYRLVDNTVQLLLGSDSRLFWVVDGGKLNSWVVRKNPGLFGFLGSRALLQ